MIPLSSSQQSCRAASSPGYTCAQRRSQSTQVNKLEPHSKASEAQAAGCRRPSRTGASVRLSRRCTQLWQLAACVRACGGSVCACVRARACAGAPTRVSLTRLFSSAGRSGTSMWPSGGRRWTRRASRTPPGPPPAPSACRCTATAPRYPTCSTPCAAFATHR